MATYSPAAYTTAAANTQIDFDIPFTFLRNTDVVVSVIDPSGNVLVAGSDYDTQLQSQSDGTFDMRVVQAGTLTTTNTPLAASHVVSIKRNTDISTILTVFQDGASFKAADINAIINQLFNKVQEVESGASEGITLTDDLLAFDAGNKPLRNLGTPTANNDAVRKIDVDSGIGPDITTVAGIASDVTSVANDATGISTVATDLAGPDNIGTVAGISSDVSTVAGISSAVTGVNNISADVTTVANDGADIGTVAADLSGSDTIGTVATSIANVNALAPQASNIGTLTQSANLTALQNAQSNAQAAQAALAAFVNKYHGTHTNVAGNDAEVLADIAGDSALTLEEGDLYFDSTNDKLRVYDGSAWHNAASVNVINATTLAAVSDVAAYSNIAQNDFIVRGATEWENASPSAARSALGLGTAAVSAATDFATAAQGTTANSALQPNTNIAVKDVTIDSTANYATGIQINKDDTNGTYIEAVYTTGGSNRTYRLRPPATDSVTDAFRWQTFNAHSFEVDDVERLRIDSNGQIVLDGLSWPTADGTADQVLKTDGAGNLAFVDQSSGGGGYVDFGDLAFTEVTSTGNITIPSGATKAFIWAIGAGGSGGNATGTDTGCFVCGGFGGNGSAGITIAALTAVTGLHATIANGDAEVRLGSSSGTLIAKGVNGGDGAAVSSGGNAAGGTIGYHGAAFTAGRVDSSGSFTATTLSLSELPGLAVTLPVGIVGGDTGNLSLGDDPVTMGFRDPRASTSTFLTSSHGGQLDVQTELLSVTYPLLDPNSAAGSSNATAQTGFGLGGIGGMVSDAATTRNGASGGPAAVVVLFQ